MNWAYISKWGNSIFLVETNDLLALMAMGLFLVSFLVQAFAGKRLRKAGSLVSLGLSGGATLLSIIILLHAEESIFPELPVHARVGWAITGDISLTLGILLTATAKVMLFIVCFITFLVHLFSKEYMRDDPRLPRYWALLGLFAFSMCGVVLGSNLFMIFIFWELVGFCSYLLIGFWFEKKVAGPASQKAFILNRIGDVGFVLAMMLIIANGGSGFDLTTNPAFIKWEDIPPLDPWVGYCLILGVFGKSAQFPLQVWLPDAMAGPTPVSSLLHAATMVAAGVYLLVRTAPILAPPVLDVLLWVGAITALMAAFSALNQTDIKGVLAYSTISQLGFMVMAVGAGATDFAFFHLATHAFFKCGLFLTAGAVIHQIHQAQHQSGLHFDAQDIRLMGGLGRKMPLTMVAYLIFAGALAGLPLFSGFFSKDGIMVNVFAMADHRDWTAMIPGILATLASGMTAFYIARHGLLVFFGKTRMQPKAFEKIQATNWTMRIPLVLLAVASLYPIKWALEALLGQGHHQHFHHEQLNPQLFEILLVLVAVGGITWAFFRWRKGSFLTSKSSFLKRLSSNHFYLDQFYEQGIARGLLHFSFLLSQFDKRIVDGAVNRIAYAVIDKDNRFSLSKGLAWFDKHIIDGMVNRIAGGVMAFGQGFRKLQGGNLQRYLMYALLGLLLLLGAMIYFA